MTAKEFVLQEYPNAVCESIYLGYIIRADKKILGVGNNSNLAWTNAKQNIKEQDLSVNPNE